MFKGSSLNHLPPAAVFLYFILLAHNLKSNCVWVELPNVCMTAFSDKEFKKKHKILSFSWRESAHSCHACRRSCPQSMCYVL